MQVRFPPGLPFSQVLKTTFYLAMQLRSSIPIFAVILLAACTSPANYSVFSVFEAGFSIEYPQGWEVEDDRPASELFAIHPPLLSGEELTQSNTLYFWVVRKQLHPSLKEFALSQRSDLDNTTCDTPSETLIGNNKYAGLHMTCANGTEHFYMEGTNHHIAVSFDAKSTDTEIFSRIKDSISISIEK